MSLTREQAESELNLISPDFKKTGFINILTKLSRDSATEALNSLGRLQGQVSVQQYLTVENIYTILQAGHNARGTGNSLVRLEHAKVEITTDLRYQISQLADLGRIDGLASSLFLLQTKVPAKLTQQVAEQLIKAQLCVAKGEAPETANATAVANKIVADTIASGSGGEPGAGRNPGRP